MGDGDLQGLDPREDGYLRVCEGILRSRFGKRPCSAAARAIEQLTREARVEAPPPEKGRFGWHEVVFEWIRRNTLVWGSAIAAIGVVVGLLFYGYGPAHPKLEIGTIVAVVGQPTLRGAPAASGRAVSVSTPIHLGDQLETGDADKAEIAFKDGTTLRLGFNTVVVIPGSKAQAPSSGTTTLRPSEVRLLRGEVWTQVQKLTNAPQYAIRTEAATAIARGTEFGVRLQRPSVASLRQTVRRSTPVAVLTVKEGVVDFSNSLGSVRATAMTESTARADTKPTEPKRLTELRALASSQGRNLSILTSPLSGVDSGERLVPGGGWSGLTLRDVLGNAGAFNAQPNQSTGMVTVVQVVRQSPAENAGIQVGDRVVAVDGQLVRTAAQADQLILVQPNIEIAFHLERAGQELGVTLSAIKRSNIVPGPTLSPADQARLWEVTRRFTGPEDLAREELLRLLPGERLRAAGENNLGVILEIDEQLGPAIRAYGSAVHLAPTVALYRFNLGLALRKIGSYERAAEELALAADLAPDSVAGRLRFAEVCSLLGRNEEALGLTEEALVEFPGSHGLWELKAQLLWRAGRLNEAREAAAKAIGLDPYCMVAHSYLAGILQDLGDLESAEASYLEAAALDPYQPLLHRRIGTLRRMRGDPPGAEASFRRSLELNPDDPVAHEELAFVLENLGRIDEAATHYRKAIELDPHDLMPLHNLADIRRRQTGGLAEAEALYRKAILLAPDHADSLSGLGTVLARQGKVGEAEQFARKAQELDSASSSYQNNLGEVLRMAGRLEEAAACYRTAIQLDPDNLSPYNNLGIICARRGEFAEAEKAFRAVVDKAARDPRRSPLSSLMNLANVCDKQGKVAEAEEFYRQALKIKPEDPDLASRLAMFLSNHHLKLDEALSLAREAALANPSSAGLLNTLGWVHFQRGELDLAEETLKRALGLAGDTVTAEEIREDLKKVNDKRSTKAK